MNLITSPSPNNPMLLSTAQNYAQKLVDHLAPACDQIAIAGSIRRQRPECDQLEQTRATELVAA